MGRPGDARLGRPEGRVTGGELRSPWQAEDLHHQSQRGMKMGRPGDARLGRPGGLPYLQGGEQ